MHRIHLRNRGRAFLAREDESVLTKEPTAGAPGGLSDGSGAGPRGAPSGGSAV